MNSNDSITKNYYIINNVVSPQTPICRYMDFDKFLHLLSGKLYVPRKMKFLDSRESGFFIDINSFAFCMAGDNRDVTKKLNKLEQEKIDSYKDNLKKSSNLLTSCWTQNNGEDYLMWKSYAPNMGVCVCTTIDKLMESIDINKDNYLPICSSMGYTNNHSHNDFLRDIYEKDSFYKSEDEIRFYFVPKGDLAIDEINIMSNDGVRNLLLETSTKEKMLQEQDKQLYEDHVVFDIDFKFIDSIILSPFIMKTSLDLIRDILITRYPEIFNTYKMIKRSKICEK